MSVKRKRSSETNISSQEIDLTVNYDETKENNLTNSNNNCVECVAKTNNIHALNIANYEARIELETEVASRKALEESNTKYRKLKQNWAIEVFQCDPSNEDLDNLLSLEPEELFKKYEKIMKGTNSDRIKVEEATETLQDVKNKLKLQTEQREIYEKQLSEIREVLHLPPENCNFSNIVPLLKDLLEENETNHCSNGLSIIESSSSHGRFSKRQKSDNSENSGNGSSSGEKSGKKGKSGELIKENPALSGDKMIQNNSASGGGENSGGGGSSNNIAPSTKNQNMGDKCFPKCQLCNYRYFTRLDLCRHFVDYHLRSRLEKCLDPASQRCPACALTYDKKQSRLRHFIWSHQDLEGLVVQDAQVRLSEFMPSLRYFKTRHIIHGLLNS